MPPLRQATPWMRIPRAHNRLNPIHYRFHPVLILTHWGLVRHEIQPNLALCIRNGNPIHRQVDRQIRSVHRLEIRKILPPHIKIYPHQSLWVRQHLAVGFHRKDPEGMCPWS